MYVCMYVYIYIYIYMLSPTQVQCVHVLFVRGVNA